MELKEIHSVYFLGIGGIGMSALARWFNANGYKVAGYDKTATPLTDALVSEGIEIHFEDDVNLIGDGFKDKKSTLVVYTPAVPKNHTELNFFLTNDFDVKKRAAVLGILTRQYFTIAVAGTHGKTTTSSMVAHILHESGVNTMAFVGGILQNYNSNLILNDPNGKAPIVVVEADEFDRSFMQLSPNISIVTTVDPDHLDIYDSAEEFNKTFEDFVQKLPVDGELIYNKGTCKINLTNLKASTKSYGLGKADVYADAIKAQDGEQVFDFFGRENIKGIKLGLPGLHNIQNAMSAIEACLQVGVSGDEVKAALATYKGVKRRFEYVIKNKDVVYVDDYAHHPSELNALIESVRYLFPDKKLTMVFQPHLYSRTNDFMDDFASSLAKVDELFLLDIYPARELPMPGVTSEALFSKIDHHKKTLTTKAHLMKDLNSVKTEVFVTAGAGDIDTFINPIKEMLSK